MYVPQALFPYLSLIVRVEGMQVCHKLVFVKEMDKLSAVKLHGIEQKDGVVDTRYDRAVGVWKATCTIPEMFVCRAIE